MHTESIIEPSCQEACGFGIVSAAVAPPRPQVRFSQYSQLNVIPKDDGSSKWLSQMEKDHIKQRLLLDVERMRTFLHDTPPDRIAKDELYECIGIEHFISDEHLEQRFERYRAHVNAVLLAQSAHIGACEKISRASERSSQWARESAEKLAKVYATQLKDE